MCFTALRKKVQQQQLQRSSAPLQTQQIQLQNSERGTVQSERHSKAGAQQDGHCYAMQQPHGAGGNSARTESQNILRRVHTRIVMLCIHTGRISKRPSAFGDSQASSPKPLLSHAISPG